MEDKLGVTSNCLMLSCATKTALTCQDQGPPHAYSITCSVWSSETLDARLDWRPGHGLGFSSYFMRSALILPEGNISGLHLLIAWFHSNGRLSLWLSEVEQIGPSITRFTRDSGSIVSGACVKGAFVSLSFASLAVLMRWLIGLWEWGWGWEWKYVHVWQFTCPFVLKSPPRCLDLYKWAFYSHDRRSWGPPALSFQSPSQDRRDGNLCQVQVSGECEVMKRRRGACKQS